MKSRIPTPKQSKILASGDNLLVIGRPGSGKTTVALWKAQDFIEQQSLEDFQRVLFLSFSNAAVERILDAAKGRGGIPRRIRRSLRVRTFHSLCVDILRPHAHLVGVKFPFTTLAPHQRKLYLSTLPEDVRSTDAGTVKADEHFRRLEIEAGLVSFDRFAPLASKVLQEHPDLRRAYSLCFPLIIVDEYQDTDDHQDDLVRTLAHTSQLICLGDDDQQIYDWRQGTSRHRLKRLEEDHGHKRIELDLVNHRSEGSGVLEYARSVLAGTPIRTPKSVDIRLYPPRLKNRTDLWSPETRQAIGRFYDFARAQEWAQWREPTLAIMMRNNSEVKSLSSILRTPSRSGKAIPHTLIANYDLVPKAWSVLFAMLQCTSVDDRLAGFDEVISQLLELEAILPNGGSQRRRQQLEKWLDRLREGKSLTGYAKKLQASLASLSQCWTGDTKDDIDRAVSVLEEIASSQKNLTNLKAMNETILIADFREEISRILSPLADQFSNSGFYQDAVRLAEKVGVEWQLMDGSRRVRRGTVLMTIHKCKGKEFDGVVLVEPPFHGRFVEDGAGEHAQEQARRLLHTAISRARQWVCIITPSHAPCPLLPGS